MNKTIYFIIALLFISIARAQRVGIGTTTPAASALLDVSSTTKGFLPPRMTTVQRNAISSPATGLTIYNTSINAFQCYNGTAWYSTVHYIGESYGGGIVFYVYDNGQHGLIAAEGDALPSQWGLMSKTTSAAAGRAHACLSCVPTSGGIGGGSMNTTIIIASQGGGGFSAAEQCVGFSITYGNGLSYEDWYLPSIDELHLLYLQKDLVGGFASDAYWSSSEYNSNGAWWETFFDGLQSQASKSNSYRVRPIRDF